MIDPNLISINWAQTFECMSILAEGKIVNRIKNFERAVIAFNALNDAQKIFKNTIRVFSCVTNQRTGSDKL